MKDKKLSYKPPNDKNALIQKLLFRMVALGYVCSYHSITIDQFKEEWQYRDKNDLLDLINDYEEEMRQLVGYDFDHCKN